MRPASAKLVSELTGPSALPSLQASVYEALKAHLSSQARSSYELQGLVVALRPVEAALADVVAVVVVQRPARLPVSMVTKPSFSPSQSVSVKTVSGSAGVRHHEPDVARLAVAQDAVRRDLHVVDRVRELAVDAAHAPRPLVVDHALEAEDQLVLVDRVHVGVDLAAQVADGAVALRVVDRADLRAEDRLLVSLAVVLERLEPLNT